MLFNSLDFIVFILAFTLLNLFRFKKNLKFAFISFFSLIFYGHAKIEYIFLILLSGVIDYFCALKLYENKKRLWLYLSLIINLGLLFYYKYLGFFLRDILNITQVETHIILPIGISFYTFQSMSYTIDVYRGELKPTRNFLKFFSYLSFFPQLDAGPIVRAKDVLDQMEGLKLQRNEELYYGLKLMIYGFFKKMVIADGVAKYVNLAFINPQYPESSLYWWSIALCFGIQIYCDFSGYTDIARGLARCFGIRFLENFNHPYLATSFGDFWNRWHISLSSWFKDYVYIPMGGNRKGIIRTQINLFFTMVISGLWHGANLTFLVWGGFHGALLVIEKLIPKKIKDLTPSSFLRILVFLLVTLSWVYFRAENIEQANGIILKMLNFNDLSLTIPHYIVTLLILIFLRESYVLSRLKLRPLRDRVHFLEPYWLGVMGALAILYRGVGDQFIYFQF